MAAYVKQTTHSFNLDENIVDITIRLSLKYNVKFFEGGIGAFSLGQNPDGTWGRWLGAFQ